MASELRQTLATIASPDATGRLTEAFHCRNMTELQSAIKDGADVNAAMGIGTPYPSVAFIYPEREIKKLTFYVDALSRLVEAGLWLDVVLASKSGMGDISSMTAREFIGCVLANERRKTLDNRVHTLIDQALAILKTAGSKTDDKK